MPFKYNPFINNLDFDKDTGMGGDVVGPGSSTAGDFAIFADTTGKLLADRPSPLDVQFGGTGVTTLTNHGVLLGQGTADVVVTTAGTAGQVLTSNGASLDPTFQAIGAVGAVTTITGDSGGAQSPSSGNFNLFGSGSITTVGTANTETVQLTGLTNHSVLVGAGTATITKVAPSATSGVPLISQGASLDPTFGTAVVAGGGTGAVTLTNHGVLLGQGTSAIAATSAGTTGQVLTSNGASLDPTFQSVSASGAITTITGDSGGAESPSAGNFNIFGTGSVTSVGTANTETIQLTGLTNHNVLIGAGTATITKVAPSSTSGVPLISQGASSDPAFGTAVVAGGGTGAVTLTNHGVLLGQGTSAIVATAAGTAGQVLQSGGGSADPAYSTATYPSTTTSQQLLYSTATNVVGQLTTANSAIAATNSSGTLAMRTLTTNRQLFTTSGTYTPTTGMIFCYVEMVGGGGGGGGAAATGATEAAAGAGGGGGGYASAWLSAATIGASQTVTIGAGGAGGVAGAAGSNGTGTVLGAGLIVFATQGIGGGAAGVSGATACSVCSGGGGGVGSGGDVNASGSSGGYGIASGTAAIFATSGAGGKSVFGGGGKSIAANSTNLITGNAGSNYGGGGSGGVSLISQAAANGGAGAPGVLVVIEFILA